MASTTARVLEPGPAAFYGVRPDWAHLWHQAKREGRDWYYADNSMFDCAREQQFRVTKNAIQHHGTGTSDGLRFRALGIPVKPIRLIGEVIVVCPQSDEFMLTVAGDRTWLSRTLRLLRGEKVLVRRKGEVRPLADDLKRARMLMTWSSAAAVTALLDGVPVKCDPQCCAHQVTDREKWACVLADQQWTLDEMAAGMAWQQLG